MNEKEELALIIAEHGQRMISAMQEGYEYMLSVEKCLSVNLEHIEKDIDEKSKGLEEIKRDELLESYGWKMHQNQFNFPSILYETTILGIYHGFEYGLNTYCEYFRWLREHPLRYTDLHGNGIKRSKLYLKKVVGIPFANVSESLGFIYNLNDLRNCIVHVGGDLPTDPKAKINRFVMGNEHLIGEPSLSVVIKPSFIPFMIEQLTSFIEGIAEEIRRNLSTNNERSEVDFVTNQVWGK